MDQQRIGDPLPVGEAALRDFIAIASVSARCQARTLMVAEGKSRARCDTQIETASAQLHGSKKNGGGNCKHSPAFTHTHLAGKAHDHVRVLWRRGVDKAGRG
jgi:hypothetical protein